MPPRKNRKSSLGMWAGAVWLTALMSATANNSLELKSLLSEDEYAAARASSLTAFYTSPVIIGAMYQALSQMGFRQGNILEPSCGVGNFIGMLPDSMADSKVYGVEIDSISGRIAQQLYQNSSIAVNGFEKVQMPTASLMWPSAMCRLAISKYGIRNTTKTTG